ncbi:SET and MYND domain-containing protein 5 [Schistosoma japonicum]|nr:SET and MYND domain-containing protein 5 [Schistosoma japonicum]
MNLTREVDFGPIRGRGLVAAQSINTEDILFTEDPLICCQFSWNKLYGYKACDHCLRPLESSEENVQRLTNNPTFTLPYSEASFQCNQIVQCPTCLTNYCSQNCLDSAALTYHSVMCMGLIESENENPLKKLDIIWRQFHYPPESGTIFLLVRIAAACLSACIMASSPSLHIVEALKQFISSTSAPTNENTSVLYHQLLGDQFVTRIEQIHNAFVEVLLFLCQKFSHATSCEECIQTLQKAGLNSLLEKHHFTSALCLISRNGQGIATSALSVWVNQAGKIVSTMNEQTSKEFDLFVNRLYEAIDDHVGSFLDNEGVGLYYYQSRINHSCSPNAVIRFSGVNSQLSVVALTAIQEGEEVTISYLDDCLQSRSRHTRRKYLSSNYLFWCDCPKCEMEKNDDTQSLTSSSEDDADDKEANGCS